MNEAAASGAGSLDTPQDAGPGERGVVTRWLKELELASAHEEHWREAAEDACRRYRDEDTDGQVGYSAALSRLGARGVSNRFNIFYSNVQIICPALYNATPRPDVRRRYRDRDAAGREVAIILERALSYSMDVYDFDQRMRQAVKDMQVVGRGVTRVRYKPYLLEDDGEGGEEKAPDGKPEPRLAYEAVCCEHVPWKAFRIGPGRTWDEVPWIAFGPHLLRKEQIEEAFGKDAAEEIRLDYTPAGCEDTASPGELVDAFRRAKVWEIWDKESRQVFWIAESVPERPLRVDEDPYGLEGFFPVPRPLYAMETTESLVPVEPFRFYREQARELSRLSARIEQVIDACRARGVYDATLSEMERLTEEGDNILIPSDTAAHLLARGGIENGIWLWPVDRIASALKYLYQQREAIKQTIYEVTGIADIMRGATDARETLGSQRLKARFGAMRIDDARREVQRYARDLVRIKAELIAEKFSADTLRQMTGVELPSPEEKALAQMEARRAQETAGLPAAQPAPGGRPAPPPPSARQEKPSWDEVLEIMRADGPRGFRVDVETDQTIAADDLDEKRAVTEFIQALAGFIQGIGPAVSAGQLPKDAAVKLLLSGLRRFRFGREVEDAFNEIGNGEEQQALPDPQAAQAAQEQAMQEQAMQQQALQQQAMQERAMQEQAAREREMRERDFAEKTRLAEMKEQADIRLAREKAALEARTAVLLAREKAELEARANRERMEGELRLQRERREAELELARLKLQAQTAMKRAEAAA
ncbi:MAG: hypothetical protein ACLFWF_14900, partial [Alphaproteobacteria bacterium]